MLKISVGLIYKILIVTHIAGNFNCSSKKRFCQNYILDACKKSHNIKL